MFKFGIKYIRKNKWHSLASFLLIGFVMWFNTSIPRLSGESIDDIKHAVDNNVSVDFSNIHKLLIYIVVAFLLMFLMTFLRRIVMFNVKKDIQKQLYDKLLTLGNDYYQNNRTGYLVTVLNQDLDVLVRFIYRIYFVVPELLLMIVFSMSYIFNRSWILSLIIIFMILTLLPVTIIIKNKYKGVYKELQKMISEVNDEIELTFYGISIVKSYLMENKRTEKFKETIKKRADIDYKATKFRIVIWSMFWVLPSLIIVIVIFFGGYMLINGYWTPGVFSAVIGYVFIINFPLMFTAESIADYPWAKACYKRMTKIFLAESEITEIKPINNPQNVTEDKGSEDAKFTEFIDKIQIKELTFHYNTGTKQKKVFNSINMEIQRGKKIGILGEVGSGKSTLLLLLLRLLTPDSGKILFDGKDIKYLDIFRYRRLFGYVPQEPVLLSSTVKENIIFGRENISNDDIDEAIQIAQFKKEIETFSNGLNEKIGPNGLTLSGGQRQRLALARALVHKPSILLLDDTTSALDTKTEKDLWEKVNTHFMHITKVVITHRASTVLDADDIYVLEHGRILEKGKPQELIDQSGSYFGNLYNKQIFDAKEINL